MNLVSSAQTMAFDDWMRGIVGGFISGGASAVSGAIILPALDAQAFNVYTAKFYIAIGALFIANGLVSITKFLAANPLPVKTVVATVETTETSKKPPVIVTTVTETHVEPISKAEK